jgi:hypothetical protein
VYGRFQGIAEFMETLNHLQKIPEVAEISEESKDWTEEMPSMVLSS